jgi:hypothetical protein
MTSDRIMPAEQRRLDHLHARIEQTVKLAARDAHANLDQAMQIAATMAHTPAAPAAMAELDLAARTADALTDIRQTLLGEGN